MLFGQTVMGCTAYIHPDELHGIPSCLSGNNLATVVREKACVLCALIGSWQVRVLQLTCKLAILAHARNAKRSCTPLSV